MTKVLKKTKSPKEENKWMLLIVMSLVGFIMFLDTTMMNVAITSIVEDLDTTVSTVQAAISLYALVMAAFMITGGKLGELYGLKKVFIIAMVMYAIGTTMAATAPNIAFLIVGWSVIEGLGVAMLLPITAVLITLNYKGLDRAKALTIFAVVASAAAAIGPIYGGAMTTYLSWRWAFASELLVVIAVFFMLKYVHAPKPEKSATNTLDIRGTALMASSLILVLVSIIAAPTYGLWSPKEVLVLFGYEVTPFGISFIPFMFAIGIGLFAWFTKEEAKLMKKGKDPLIDITAFKNKKFTSSVIVGGFLAFVLNGFIFIFPVFLQTGFNYTAMQTGVALLPLTFSMIFFSLFFTPLGSKFSPRTLSQLGLGIMIIGLLVIDRDLSIDIVTRDLIPGLLIFGAGVGIITSQITNLAMTALSKDLTTEASGINNTLRQFGTSLGVAILGTILISGFSYFAKTSLASSDILSEEQQVTLTTSLEQSTQEMTAVQMPTDLSDEDISQITMFTKESSITAMTATIYTAIFTLVIALFLSRKLSKEKFAKS